MQPEPHLCYWFLVARIVNGPRSHYYTFGRLEYRKV